ncbi:MAG TPA: Gmad2 immunoglobulin-like domain-containing protein [Candidatus Dojkabacteria bacterium]|jgi:hypothetical protein
MEETSNTEVIQNDKKSSGVFLKIVIFLFILITILLLAVIAYMVYQDRNEDDEDNESGQEEQQQNESQNEDSEVESEDEVEQDKILYEIEDRLKIVGPDYNQTISGSEYTVKGEMKGFFEGVMNVRIIDNEGNVLIDEIVMAEGDNYTDFVEFTKTFDLSPFLSTIPAATLEFYEVSAKDGTDNVLLSMTLLIEGS